MEELITSFFKLSFKNTIIKQKFSSGMSEMEKNNDQTFKQSGYGMN